MATIVTCLKLTAIALEELLAGTKFLTIFHQIHVFTLFLISNFILFSFGKSHISAEEGRTIKINSSFQESSRNFLPKEVQHSLRKRSYDFEKSTEILSALDSNKKNKKGDGPKSDETSPPEQPMGYSADHDLIPLKPPEKKKVGR